MHDMYAVFSILTTTSCNVKFERSLLTRKTKDENIIVVEPNEEPEIYIRFSLYVCMYILVVRDWFGITYKKRSSSFSSRAVSDKVTLMGGGEKRICIEKKEKTERRQTA